MVLVVLFLSGEALGSLANGEGLGLFRKDQIKGLPIVCLSFMYAAIIFLIDGKGLMCESHGLHIDDCAL